MLAGIVLFIAIVIIIIALRFKVPAWMAVTVTAVLLAVMSMPLSDIPTTLTGSLLSSTTITLLITTLTALAFAKVLEKAGLVAKLADSLAYFNPKISYVLTPLLLSIAPMPGSSILAYSINKKPSKDFDISRTQSVFIQHWLSRVFEFSLPLFPSVIMTAAILGIGYLKIFVLFLPLTVAAIIIGVGYSYYLFNKNKDKYNNQTFNHERHIKKGLIGLGQSIWPIGLLVVLVFASLQLWLALALVMAVTALVMRLKWSSIKVCLTEAMRPNIIALLLAVMVFAGIITEGHAAQSAFDLLTDIGMPEVIILAVLPFIVHFAVGGNAAMIAVSFPMLMPFFEADGVLLAGAVMLAFVSARAGGLASPANNGFIMLAEYSQTRMRRVYKYLLPAVAILMFLGVVFFIYI